MRYKLVQKTPDGDKEVTGQRKKTKADVKAWIVDGIENHGLDWRVGYTIKFRDKSEVFSWQWIRTGLELK